MTTQTTPSGSVKPDVMKAMVDKYLNPQAEADARFPELKSSDARLERLRIAKITEHGLKLGLERFALAVCGTSLAVDDALRLLDFQAMNQAAHGETKVGFPMHLVQ